MRTTINLACDKELRKLYQWSDKTRTHEELAQITATLQETYTGNYKVVERYRPDLQYWGPSLVFDDPMEETLFILKWAV